MINVISLGAGKQSTYLLLTALEGKYEHRPDYAIFSDVGCEPKYVYDYLEWLKKYVKDRYNFDITIVTAGNLKKDIESYLDGKRKRVSTLPYRLGNNGGIMMRQCTNDYKIAPIRRELQKIRNKQKIRLWIGISLDEIERMKYSDVQYIENYYPLVENGIRISEIKNWYRINVIPEPGKSSCSICPFHSDSYWKEFKRMSPDEFNEVCEFDKKIRDYPKLKQQAYLSKHLKQLSDIDFETNQMSLFPELIEDCYGLCGI